MGNGKKRATPMSEKGIVLSWKTSDDGGNRGFGFIERVGGERIFVHKSQIKDGDALMIGTEVQFDARADPKPDKPDNMMSTNVRGGVCYNLVFKAACAHGKRCRYSHAQRAVVRSSPAPPPPPLSLEDAAAVVAAARGSGPPHVFVDTVEACQAHCERLERAGVVAVDFEGHNLCRDGVLLLAQLAAADGPVALIDVHTLGAAAFEVGGLRALLESQTCLKVIFDGRADSDALYHLHGTHLKNVRAALRPFTLCTTQQPHGPMDRDSVAQVCDVQVLCARHLDAASASGAAGEGRPLGAGRLPGLGRALARCPGLEKQHRDALEALKTAAHKLFDDDSGHNSAIWEVRPLAPALVEYAAADVAHLHTMRAAWDGLVSAKEMAEITSRRIEKAIRGESCAKGPQMAERDF
jgi:cold shock CspA family protein